ncbi:MAG: VOC family protein [Chryseolinea sp.]
MLQINKLHHVAIICSDYKVSKEFYVNILGFRILAEHYREKRNSYKLDLMLGENYCVELFSFPNPPKRVSRPEANGLRHLAFEVTDIDAAVTWLNNHQVNTEPIRIDEYTNKRYTFFSDPDDLPLEFYER